MPKIKKLKKFSVISNLFYLAPVCVSLFFGMYATAGLFMILAVSSALFHMYKNKTWSLIDTCISYVVIIQTLFLLNVSTVPFWGSAALVGVVTIALLIRYEEEDGTRDDLWHGLWHGAVAVVLTMVIVLHNMV